MSEIPPALPGEAGGRDLSGAVPVAPAPLTAWRRVDWRFLLPPERTGCVGYLGRFPEEEVSVLRESGVRVVADPPSGCDLDVALVAEADETSVVAAVAAVRPEGWVLVRLGSLRSRPWSRLRRGSVAGWRRRLQAHGLAVPTAYWHAPTEQRSSYVVALDDEVALTDMLRRYHGVRHGLAKSLVARALHRAGVVEILARDVTVVAQRPAARPEPTGSPGSRSASPLDEAELAPLLRKGALAALLVTPWFEASRHVVRVYLDRRTGGRAAVTKVPRRPWDVSGILREASSLEALAACAGGPAGQVPNVLRLGLGARPFLAETAVDGKPAAPEVVRAQFHPVLHAGFDFVSRLPRTGRTADESDWFARLLDEPLRRVAELVPLGTSATDLVARTLGLLEPLSSLDLPLVFEHGDLGHPNILLMRDGRLGALDWERSELRGLPGHDLCFFLQYMAEARRSAFERAAQLDAFDDAFIGRAGWARPWLSRHLDALAVDPALLPSLVLASWARSSASLVDRLALTVGPGASPGEESGVGGSALAEAFALDRDFALWQHSAARFHDLIP